METLKTINFIIAVIFFVCYTYQFLYIPVPWLRKEKPHGPAKANRYAVLICARNEQRVIGDLIASLRGQTYDQSLLSIFVLADNCTDDTAMVARVAGAHVYERFNQVRVGKGYALQELLEHLEQDYPRGSAASENMLFYGGKAHKLSQVCFHIPQRDGRDDFLSPWRFTSDDGRFEMKFDPILDRAACTDVKLIKSDQHQVFGRFTGAATLDDGRVIQVRDMLGFAEKVENKW